MRSASWHSPWRRLLTAMRLEAEAFEADSRRSASDVSAGGGEPLVACMAGRKTPDGCRSSNNRVEREVADKRYLRVQTPECCARYAERVSGGASDTFLEREFSSFARESGLLDVGEA